MPKITFFQFSAISGWSVRLPRVMVLTLYDFLASVGIFKGVYYLSRPNFHFWVCVCMQSFLLKGKFAQKLTPIFIVLN